MKLDDIKQLLLQTFREWNEDKASRLAASLSYYTVFSLPPLLILSLAIISQFYDTAVARAQLEAQLTGLLGNSGAGVITDILAAADEPQEGLIAAVVSAVTLIFGASGVFGQLQGAMDTIWEVQPRPGRGIVGSIKDRFLSFTMVLVVAFLLLVSLMLSAGLQALSDYLSALAAEAVIVAQLINFVVSFGVISLLFALIFKVVPDVKIGWRDVAIGAIATAALFTIGKWAIGLYLGRSAPGSAYGAAGSLIVILLWVYYSAQILFLGAEFTQVYANRYGARIVAAPNAVPLTEQTRVHQGIPKRETVTQRLRLADAAATPRAFSRGAPGSLGADRPDAPGPIERAIAAYHEIMIQVLAVPLAAWRLLRGRRDSLARHGRF